MSRKRILETAEGDPAMLSRLSFMHSTRTRSGGKMKAFIAALAVMFVFAVGPVSAAHTDSQGQGDSAGGCSKSKWEDT